MGFGDWFKKRNEEEFLVERIKNMRNVWDIATKLLISLIQSHYFLSGNKRTALEVTKGFLNNNGYNFNIGKDLELLYRIARNEIDFKEVREWIRKHTKKVNL